MNDQRREIRVKALRASPITNVITPEKIESDEAVRTVIDDPWLHADITLFACKAIQVN